jgi:hypothetical protein
VSFDEAFKKSRKRLKDNAEAFKDQFAVRRSARH